MRSLIIALTLVTPMAAWAESVQITEETIPFVYETKAEIPTSTKILAGLISEDYFKAEDEFTAHEMFEKIEPVVVKRIATAKETKLWRIEINAMLAEYDFETKAFPTGFAETTFIPYANRNQSYAAIFSNHESFRKVPVDMDIAKTLSAKLRKSRRAKLIVEGSIKEALEKNINGFKRKTISFEISKIAIKLEDGTLVGEYPKTENELPIKETSSINDGSAKPDAKQPGKAAPTVDPVGEWTTGDKAKDFSLCLWQSGEARGEFDAKGESIYLLGRWELIKDGKWVGYVNFTGTVEYWGKGETDVTPKDEKFSLLFDPSGEKLTYVKGGVVTNKDNGKFYPAGVDANEDLVLHRQNNSRPIRMEPGNK